ncbi:uncharacterized protein BDR25DRAFT_313454 [Lindgomyces ingoldianus]|uniref:Uncharacterized protein n=1 Tax=Lindgomyces ingoldianus TaxID=673940 RepID=A0ACB6QZN7_9PLEO|nr:uncharacterized protein BDR25DRAFT_313454 [Lindgomyces ingoldianus]KAF2472305.1 hypothetical protein BDR25DRAFT_313454 [Lindgomyces ingoldianus]
MRALLFLAIYGACFSPKRAYASPGTTTPPASLITPAPVLHGRFARDFVGYVLFLDGDTSVRTCNTGYTYTYTNGYAGCVRSLGDLGTECDGSTVIFTYGHTSECSYACVTDFYLYSLNDREPAWGIHCATRTTGWKVLHMSSEDLPSGKITITQPIKPSTPPDAKTIERTVTVHNFTAASAPNSGSPSPTKPSQVQKNNGALIGGAVAGSLVFIGLIIASIIFFLSRRRQKQGRSEEFVAHGTRFMGMDRSVPNSPAPFSPPPEYTQEKSPSTTVSIARKPVQQPGNVVRNEVHEAYGEPVYANELPAHCVQPQRRSELG